MVSFALTWLGVGLYTYYCLAFVRSHTYSRVEDYKDVVLGFITVVILGPIAPIVILYLDVKDRNRDEFL